jgi:endoglucanase
MPGMLVGGANAGFNDPYSKAVLTGSAAGLSYVDNEQSYSCNEITIYWNSPLIYAMTGLMSEN